MFDSPEESSAALSLSAVPQTIAFKRWNSRSCKVVRRLLVSNPAPAPFAQACFIQGAKTRRFALRLGAPTQGDTSVTLSGDALLPFVIGPKQSLSLKVTFVPPTSEEPDYLFSDFQDTITIHAKETTLSVLLYAVLGDQNDDDGFQPSSASLRSLTLPRPRASLFSGLLRERVANNPNAISAEFAMLKCTANQMEEVDAATDKGTMIGKETSRISVDVATSQCEDYAIEEQKEGCLQDKGGRKSADQEGHAKIFPLVGEGKIMFTGQPRDERDAPSNVTSTVVSNATESKKMQLPSSLRDLLAPVDSSEDAMSIITKMRAGRGRQASADGSKRSDFAAFDALVRKSTSTLCSEGAASSQAAAPGVSSVRQEGNGQAAEDEAAFYKAFIKEEKMKALKAEYGDAAEDVYKALEDVHKTEMSNVEVKAKDAAKAARKRMQMRDDAFRKSNAVAARMCDIARGRRPHPKVRKPEKGQGNRKGKDAFEVEEEQPSSIDWDAMKYSLKEYEHDEQQFDALASPFDCSSRAMVSDKAKDDDLSWFVSEIVHK